MHHAANTDISALPLEALDIRTDCALRFHVDAPYLHAEMLGIDHPVVWVGPDGYEVGHRIEWGATHGEVAIMPVANFGGVERIHVFAGGGASFANTDFSVLPADTIVSCVNDSDPRVTSMELVFDTSLGDTGDYEPVQPGNTNIGLPLDHNTEYTIEVEVTAPGRNPERRIITGTPAETVVSGEGIGVSYEETLFNLGYSGEHRMKVAGTMPKMAFRDQHYEDIPNKLVAVVEWSDLTWDDTVDGYERAFHGCANLLTTGYDVSYDGTDWVPVAGSDAEYVPAPQGSLGQAFRDCVRYGDPDRVGSDCDIGDWSYEAVTSLESLLQAATAFDLPMVDLSTSDALVSLGSMFKGATSFNQAVSFDDTSQVQSFARMFEGATSFNNGEAAGQGGTFTLDIGTGRTSADVMLNSMFKQTDSFNQNLNSWDTTNVQSTDRCFQQSVFNNGNDPGVAGVLTWTTPNLQVMGSRFGGMFAGNSAFNCDVSSFDVSGVTDIRRVFRSASAFNNGGASLTWTIASTNVYDQLFEITSFNQSLPNIDFTGVTSAERMFQSSSFNQDVSDWDTSALQNAVRMFDSSSFDQDIGDWEIDSLQNADQMLQDSAMSQANYEALLVGWESYANTPQNVNFSEQDGMKYAAGSAAETARQNLINNDGWSIDGDTAV